MENFLFGQQRGFTEYPCFICMWRQALEPERVDLTWGSESWKPNIVNDPIVSQEHISSYAHQAVPDESLSEH